MGMFNKLVRNRTSKLPPVVLLLISNLAKGRGSLPRTVTKILQARQVIVLNVVWVTRVPAAL